MMSGMKFCIIDDVDVDGDDKLHWWIEASMMLLLFKGQMMIAAWYGVVAAKSNIK